MSNNVPIAVKISTGHTEYVDLAEQAREAELLRKIPRHENIVQMHDYIKNEYRDESGIQMIEIYVFGNVTVL